MLLASPADDDKSPKRDQAELASCSEVVVKKSEPDEKEGNFFVVPAEEAVIRMAKTPGPDCYPAMAPWQQDEIPGFLLLWETTKQTLSGVIPNFLTSSFAGEKENGR